MALPLPVIDQMPEAKRQMIVDALLQGKSTRDVAAMAGISFQQVASYKRKHLYPAVKMAVNNLLDEGETPDAVRDSSGTRQVVERTKSLTYATPFRDRLEKLWHRTDRALDLAETAVRVVKDKDGNDVVVGQDIACMAPLLNQAHKNCEILGRATGELVQTEAQIAIQIVLPSATSAPAAAGPSQIPTINIAPPKR